MKMGKKVHIDKNVPPLPLLLYIIQIINVTSTMFKVDAMNLT